MTAAVGGDICATFDPAAGVTAGIVDWSCETFTTADDMNDAATDEIVSDLETAGSGDAVPADDADKEAATMATKLEPPDSGDKVSIKLLLDDRVES